MKITKRNYKRIVFICLIILMFTWATTAFAIALDLNVSELTQNYLNKLFSNDSTQAQLEAEKEKVKQQTLNYVDQYKTDITNQLTQYQQQQLDLSRQELNRTYNDVKKQLDDSKQQVLDQYKQIINDNISKGKDKVQQELDNELQKEITAKFN